MPPAFARALEGTAPGEGFYAAYSWCLDPVLSLRDLLRRLGEELPHYGTREVDWEREECRINFYLFACAIACTVDDYLGSRAWNLERVAERVPRLRRAVKAAETALNLPYRLRSRLRDARLPAWRRQWGECVDAACGLLLGGGIQPFVELAGRGLARAAAALPGAALDRRMRIPEGFRCQDLTHHDVCAMTARARESLAGTDRPVVIVGPRTAGAYFAPLAAACLRAAGHTRVRWITVRPRTGLAAAERRAISASIAGGAAVLVIDDHQNTGRTFRVLIGALCELGAKPRDITVAIPGHPARPGWTLPEEEARGVRFSVLPPEQRHKARLLKSGWLESVLREHYGVAAIELPESRETAALNAAFEAHFSEGFQVRLKRVFEARLGRGEAARAQRVVAKSVGWGWLGYHAWVAGLRLAGFVPRPLALRDGILVSEWVEGATLAARGEKPGRMAGQLGAYVAQRVQSLPLDADPYFDSPAYRWCGWNAVAVALRGVYGRYTGRLKTRALLKRLQRYVTPQPALVDGSMRPEDWVCSPQGLSKTDFEHHNFGGGELDIVDAAWDLAAAAFEFHLPEDAERRLVASYIGKSGDSGVSDRLMLHRILYALTVMRSATYWIGRLPAGEKRQDCNRRYNAAWDFATFHLARYCGRGLGPEPEGWTRRLFFLDLDGVLDWDFFFFGFPHTTPAGVRALRLLRTAGFSVIPNTARSLEHVRAYCDAYRLPGGIAELGSVFWDAIQRQAILRVDSQAAEQLQRIGEQIQKVPGVFVDPGNVGSVRAYRFEDGRTRSLAAGEIMEALARAGCDRLTFSQSRADTYIIQKGGGKGAALREIRAYLGCSAEPVAAMGDSDRDLDMLAAADSAYAPANASPGVREMIRRGGCRRMRGRLQLGLLEAALELCGGQGGGPERPPAPASLIDSLLRVPDRGRFRKALDALRWGAL
jgi:hydroxymethylpyrimidine pyrophosphatase-like HAD family hydrolase